jgi:hypothetical protein
MAISLTTLRGERNTSIHGRRLALDRNDFITGPKGFREPVFELTSASTAQTLSDHGLTVINVTSAVTTATNSFFLPNPVPGGRITVRSGVRGTTSTDGSTAIMLGRASTAFYIESSVDTSGVAVLLAKGQAITLEGITTGYYNAVGSMGLPTNIATS